MPWKQLLKNIISQTPWYSFYNITNALKNSDFGNVLRIINENLIRQLRQPC